MALHDPELRALYDLKACLPVFLAVADPANNIYTFSGLRAVSVPLRYTREIH